MRKHLKDNTESRETQLRDAGKHTERIVNGYSGFIYTISKDYKIEFMNKTLMDHIGRDATGSDCFNLIHGLNERCPWCVGDKVLSGESANFDYKSPRDNRWYYYVCTPRTNSQNEVVAQQLISIDIHDRKQQEENLLEKQ